MENINENQEVIAKGSLKVTVTDVAFTSKTLSLKWPLTGIREYGFHSTERDLFLFEAGRRCEQNEGLYAFRCRRPQAVYDEFERTIDEALAKRAGKPVPKRSRKKRGEREKRESVNYVSVNFHGGDGSKTKLRSVEDSVSAVNVWCSGL